MGADSFLVVSGDLLGHDRDLLPAGSGLRHRDLIADARPPAIAVEPEGGGQQRSPGLHGQRGRASHHPRLLPEELHLDAAAGDVPVRDQADQAPGPQSLGQHAKPAVPAAGREYLHAEPFTELQEPLEQGLRLEPLGDRGERADAAADDPGPGQLVVAGMRQGDDHPAARGQVPLDVLLAGRVHIRLDPVLPDRGQPERLQPVAGVGAHGLPGQRPQFLAGHGRAGHPAQVRLEHLDPGSLAAPGDVRAELEGAAGPGFRYPAHQGPAQGVPGVGQPVP